MNVIQCGPIKNMFFWLLGIICLVLAVKVKLLGLLMGYNVKVGPAAVGLKGTCLAHLDVAAFNGSIDPCVA